MTYALADATGGMIILWANPCKMQKEGNGKPDTDCHQKTEPVSLSNALRLFRPHILSRISRRRIPELHLGVAGVAWATLIAQGISALLSFFFLMRKLQGLKPTMLRKILNPRIENRAVEIAVFIFSS